VTTIILYPTLEECIETAARNRYKQLTAAVLSDEEPPAGAVAELELLHAFLTSVDFRRLRAESERALLQGSHVSFSIRGVGQKFTFEMTTRQEQ